MTPHTEALTTPVTVLNDSLAQTNSQYQQLLKLTNSQGKAQRLGKRGGQSILSLTESCAQVLVTTLENSMDSQQKSLVEDFDFYFDEDDFEDADDNLWPLNLKLSHSINQGNTMNSTISTNQPITSAPSTTKKRSKCAD